MFDKEITMLHQYILYYISSSSSLMPVWLIMMELDDLHDTPFTSAPCELIRSMHYTAVVCNLHIPCHKPTSNSLYMCTYVNLIC